MGIRGLMALVLTGLTLALPPGAVAREVVDMAGRKVTIPERIERVYGSAPPLTVLLHAVAPERLVGVNFALSEDSKRFVPPHMASLPVIGGVFGMGKQMNPENILALKPDVVLAWKSPFVDQAKVEEAFARINIPVVFVTLDTLADWPAALQFTGRLLNRESRTGPEADYVEKALAKVQRAVADIPEKQRVRVYYAEGGDGLATDCHRSFHTEAIELAGGYNVYRCEPKDHMGLERISLEQVLAFDPQVILVQDLAFLATLEQDPRWKAISAVKTGRVYGIPRLPHNWLDRPPSFMRALGIQWLANLFYPQRFPLDLRAETRQFYRLMLDYSPSDADLDILLNPLTPLSAIGNKGAGSPASAAPPSHSHH